MGRKIEVTASEMMALRNEGYSNKDIANLLEINPITVRRYIGCQPQRHMENMAAFKEKPKTVAQKARDVETPEIKRAVDEIVVQSESISSKSGTIKADIDYKSCSVIIGDDILFTFDELPELATFIIGMTERIVSRMPKKVVSE
jgi:predicted transcriptional regulator